MNFVPLIFFVHYVQFDIISLLHSHYMHLAKLEVVDLLLNDKKDKKDKKWRHAKKIFSALGTGGEQSLLTCKCLKHAEIIRKCLLMDLWVFFWQLNRYMGKCYTMLQYHNLSDIRKRICTATADDPVSNNISHYHLNDQSYKLLWNSKDSTIDVS